MYAWQQYRGCQYLRKLFSSAKCTLCNSFEVDNICASSLARQNVRFATVGDFQYLRKLFSSAKCTLGNSIEVVNICASSIARQNVRFATVSRLTIFAQAL